MTYAAPEVSVVIPLFNKERHVARAIQSVLNQTHRDSELVVIDDGSTDGSANVVESFSDPRIRLVRQQNAGPSAARNRGIAEARADLIAFLDADDEWLPEHLATILRMRRRFPDCGAYATARRIVEKDGVSWIRTFTTIPAPPWEGIIPSFFRTVLLDGEPVHTSAAAIPRHVFDSVGAFALGAQRGEDTDMWCRIALQYPISYSHQVGEVTHQEAENRVSNGPAPLDFPMLECLEKAVAARVLPAGVSLADVVDYKDLFHISCAVRCIQARLPKKAREHLRAAVTTNRYRRARQYWYARSFVPFLPWDWARGVKRLITRVVRVGSIHGRFWKKQQERL